jgi:hypothetical protein
MGSGGTAPRGASRLMIVGGLALAVLTFVTWYDVAGVQATAWDALRRSDVVIFAAGLVAAACGAWLGFGNVGPEQRAVALIGGGAAAIGALIVIVRMVSPPGDDTDLKIGIFLALLAGGIAAIGGLIALSAQGPPAAPRPSGPPPGER